MSINSKKCKISHREIEGFFQKAKNCVKINFVRCRYVYHSSCFEQTPKLSGRTSKNSDELRACIEKAYVFATYSVQIISANLKRLSHSKNILPSLRCSPLTKTKREARKKTWKQLIDVHEKTGFNPKKKLLRARIIDNRCK